MLYTCTYSTTTVCICLTVQSLLPEHGLHGGLAAPERPEGLSRRHRVAGGVYVREQALRRGPMEDVPRLQEGLEHV